MAIKMVSTKGNSKQYGKCEVCECEATEIFHVFDYMGHEKPDVFGCEKCCLEVFEKYSPDPKLACAAFDTARAVFPKSREVVR